jgi:hypothetical protein
MGKIKSLTEAKEMTKRHRDHKGKIKHEETGKNIVLPNAETINREHIEKLLAQEGVTAVRLYYGMDPNHNVSLMAVGVAGDKELHESIIYSDFPTCPPYCPKPPYTTLND